jgi:hypothetical protein
MRIRNQGRKNLDPGWKTFGSGIRDTSRIRNNAILNKMLYVGPRRTIRQPSAPSSERWRAAECKDWFWV